MFFSFRFGVGLAPGYSACIGFVPVLKFGNQLVKDIDGGKIVAKAFVVEQMFCIVV